MTIERKARSDAQRNHEAILSAAEIEFRGHGLNASIDDIAGRAGVGVGTVYRNYATKEELVRAVLEAHVEPLIVEAREATESDDAGAAFFRFLRSVGEKSCSFRAMADALTESGFDLGATHDEVGGPLLAAIGDLLAKAQRAGAVRSDVGIAEVFALLGGVVKGDAGSDPVRMARCVDLLCDALRYDAVRAAG